MEASQQYNTKPASSGIGFSILTIIFVILGLVGLYFLYKYLYGTTGTNVMTISSGQNRADISPVNPMPMIPTPYEGGEYSFNTWLYISSFNKNRNTRKHIFEIQGKYFSTLLVGLGAYNNTLIVRTQTSDPAVQGFQNAGYTPDISSVPTNTTPPTAADTVNVGNLSTDTVNEMFQPLAMNDSLVTTPVMCDLPEIDLQRWTMVTVVLAGRTIDVYIDGKLARSCVTPSFFKVDPTGVKGVMSARGGFDGYTGITSVANYAMNPDEIYRAYNAGPTGSSMDIGAWFKSIFHA